MTGPEHFAESVAVDDDLTHYMMAVSRCRQERADLVERLHRAVDRLGGLASDPSIGRFEAARLNGKVEGVKLALSYFNEPAQRDGEVCR